MTRDPLIAVEDFHKVYRETIAVRGLHFVLHPGEILGLVGPNGAGKTTTMRAITGIIPPTHGRLTVAGHDVVLNPVEAKRSLAYVPDDPHLFEALTVWEHLTFTASVYQVADYRSHAEELLVRFELTEKRDAIVQELSRGMRQKVAICCAYLHNPRVILFDEPLTGLDPRGIRTLKQSVKDHVAHGGSALISSHLLALVEDLCTHLLILHRGERLFLGSLSDARAAFAGLNNDNSLEEVFFRATETMPSPPVLPTT